jgi:hypothetical protein
MKSEVEIRERLEELRKPRSSPHFLRGVGKVKQPVATWDHVTGTKAVYISALEWVLTEPIRCPHCGEVIEEQGDDRGEQQA